MHLNRLKRQIGGAMIEMMLAAGVMLSMGAFMLQMTANANRDISAKTYVDRISVLQNAGQEYFLSNRSSILAATADGTGATDVCKVNVNPTTGAGGTVANSTTKHTCAVDVPWLQWKGVLSMSFLDKTPEGSKWAVIYRQTTDGSSILTGNVEMLIVPASTVGTVTASPVNELSKWPGVLEKAVAVAQVPGIGVVPNSTTHPCGWHASDNYQRYICGSGGAWKVRVGDFVN